MMSQGPSSRAPPTRGPRANYAWESRSRTSARKPPPNYPYGFETKPHHGSHRGTYSRQGKPYSGSHYHDVLTGSRLRTEEAEREMDNIRNEPSMFRAMQLIGLLVVSIGMFTGLGRHMGWIIDLSRLIEPTFPMLRVQQSKIVFYVNRMYLQFIIYHYFHLCNYWRWPRWRASSLEDAVQVIIRFWPNPLASLNRVEKEFEHFRCSPSFTMPVSTYSSSPFHRCFYLFKVIYPRILLIRVGQWSDRFACTVTRTGPVSVPFIFFNCLL